MIQITNENKCTGCGACCNACTHHAITMAQDKYGYTMPSINQQVCVDCGFCERVCPNNYPVELHLPECGYGLHAKDENEHFSSASGGVAAVVSHYIVNQGGIVYGCTGEDMRHTRHVRIDSEKELNRLKSSKYVQSDIGDIYKCVKKDLCENLQVLFVGTPCQVAGLRSFLRKEYKNLYTLDFVCHGVPSQLFVNAELDIIQRKHDISNTTLLYRHKRPFTWFERKKNNARKCWLTSTYGLHFEDRKGNISYSEIFPNNNYMVGFLLGMTYREACYSCNYSHPERPSDITCGDYHDPTLEKDQQGYGFLESMFTANTDKGKQLWDKVKNEFVYAVRSYPSIVEAHEQLYKPMPRHRYRNIFLRMLLSDGYEMAIKKCTAEDKRRIQKDWRIWKLRYIAGNIPGLKNTYKKILKPICKTIIRR